MQFKKHMFAYASEDTIMQSGLCSEGSRFRRTATYQT